MAKFISLVGTPKYKERLAAGNLVESIVNIDNFKSIGIDADADNFDVIIDAGDVSIITIAELSTLDQAERIVDDIERQLDRTDIIVIKLRDLL